MVCTYKLVLLKSSIFFSTQYSLALHVLRSILVFLCYFLQVTLKFLDFCRADDTVVLCSLIKSGLHQRNYSSQRHLDPYCYQD